MITDPKPEGYKLPECIYDEDLSSQSSVTIDNLNGDRDYTYLIEIEGSAAITANPTLESNLGDSWSGDGFYYKDDAGYFVVDGDESGKAKLGEGFVGGGATNHISIEAELKVKTGLYRKLRSDCSLRNSSYKARAFLSAIYNGTSINLTSMTLNFGGSFTGNVTIYRVLKK